jgi:hypothetical protein
MPRRLPCVLLLVFSLPPVSGGTDFTVSPRTGRLTATRRQTLIVVSGDHFRVHIDAAKGGEITSLELFDGSDWNRVLGADEQTCPMIRFTTPEGEFRVVNNSRARVERFDARPELVKFEILTAPCDAAGRTSPWTVRLAYEVYPEGALFIDMDWELPANVQDRSQTGVSLVVDHAITAGPKYRQVAMAVLDDPAAFESARVALGTDPRLSYTNEIQAILEEKRPLAGAAEFHAETGRFTWNLADGKAALRGPIHYHNRFCLALGSGAAGFRRSNLIGQRIYHWINFLNKSARSAWYPTEEQIDQMAAHHATVLILHNYWMLRGGENGNPHADYRTARDEEALRRTIAHAHRKNMRVGLYCRGIERYGLDARFFERYCRRDGDGLYVDWHGPQCVAHHERKYAADAALGDHHFSPNGSRLPARDYFLFLRRLRRIVGTQGFLIGHQGFGAAGVLPNLVCDAYLAGEAASDHTMFTEVDQAVYRGMMGGGVCNPWTLDSPEFSRPEGIAKMAAWGFFPHVCLGMERASDKRVFPLDPNENVNEFALPYWRILAAIDMHQAQVFNLPVQKPVAATCSDEDFRALIYKERGQKYLVVVVNLGHRQAKTIVDLDPVVLGMSGSYILEPVDSQKRAATPPPLVTTRFESNILPPWGIEGFRLLGKSPPQR